jgi:L-iditol 2-dehydrogenase
MKEAVLTGIEKIEIRECPEPTIQNSLEVLLKVNAVGICGSDIHYYKKGRIGNQKISYPFKSGHEFVATVIEIGKDVTRVYAGDQVAVDPAISCGVCDQCVQDRKHTCRNLKFMGNPGEHEGCLSEYVVLPESCCYQLNKNIDLIDSVLIEPLSIANYAVKFIENKAIRTVGILGMGPIGIGVMLNLRSYNVERIYVSDKLDYRILLAKEFSPVWGGNPDKLNFVYEITKSEPMLLDAVFECCGQQEAINQSVELLKPGGHLIIIGIPEVDEILFDIHTLRRKEITVHNVRRQNKCIESAIDFIVKNKDVSKLVTHNFNINEIKEAFEIVAGYKDEVIKAVVQFD